MKISKIALCCILIATIVFMLCGCSAKKIDWKMQGAWVTGDGEVMESMELSIYGKIHMDESGVDTLDLDIRLPDSFCYSFNDISKHTSDYRKYIPLPYCVSHCIAYNKVDNYSLAAVFAICPEKEYAIFDWNDSNDYFLIASKEPLNDPQEILTYFKVSSKSISLSNIFYCSSRYRQAYIHYGRWSIVSSGRLYAIFSSKGGCFWLYKRSRKCYDMGVKP